jgi:hypothetical protein
MQLSHCCRSCIAQHFQKVKDRVAGHFRRLFLMQIQLVSLLLTAAIFSHGDFRGQV